MILQFPTPDSRAYAGDLLRQYAKGHIKRSHMNFALAQEMRKYGVRHMYLPDCKLTMLEPAVTPAGTFDIVMVQPLDVREYDRCPSCGGGASRYISGESGECCAVCGTAYKRRAIDETIGQGG